MIFTFSWSARRLIRVASISLLDGIRLLSVIEHPCHFLQLLQGDTLCLKLFALLLVATKGVHILSLQKTPKTFYDKMKKGVFDSDEITAIVEDLGIENPMEIFFAEEVTY